LFGQLIAVRALLFIAQFTRKTTKYWVHPSNILRLKLALTKQLPLLVYGADDPVSSGDIASVAAQEHGTTVCLLEQQQQQHKVTSLVSSGGAPRLSNCSPGSRCASSQYAQVDAWPKCLPRLILICHLHDSILVTRQHGVVPFICNAGSCFC
jgi:hypothetical protein